MENYYTDGVYMFLHNTLCVQCNWHKLYNVYYCRRCRQPYLKSEFTKCDHEEESMPVNEVEIECKTYKKIKVIFSFSGKSDKIVFVLKN